MFILNFIFKIISEETFPSLMMKKNRCQMSSAQKRKIENDVGLLNIRDDRGM